MQLVFDMSSNVNNLQ